MMYVIKTLRESYLSENNDVSAKFKSALKSEIAKRTTPDGALAILLDHKDVIKEARELRISHGRISEILSDAGVPATQDLIRRFCIKYLNEVPVPRKKKRKPKTAHAVQKNSAVKKERGSVPEKQATRSSKKGFRVAGGDL